LQCVLFFQAIKEVNGHTSEQTSQSSEVTHLLKSAEHALSKLDDVTALNLFEKAALIVHSSEVEVGIVRAHMQAGNFQRALAFCAHASGAHLEERAPSLLYAHLLKISGQTAYAEKLMTEYQIRFGKDVSKFSPVKLSPYSDATGLPTNARMIASGLTLPGNKHVVFPSTAIGKGVKKYWVRSGSGSLSEATLQTTIGKALVTSPGLAILQLNRAVTKRNTPPLAISSKAAFPGSVAFGLTFKHYLALSWPSLWSAFIGKPVANNTNRREIDIPENTQPIGATVFDQTGAAIGLMVLIDSKLQLVPLSELGLDLTNTEQSAARPKLATDQIYQVGLNNMVQVLGSS
jgi:hypothetical protein